MIILDIFINDYFRYFCDYQHIENINEKGIKTLLRSSLLKIYSRYSTIPEFKEIDIILYILDLDEHYHSNYFLMIYEILFTNTDYEQILKKYEKYKKSSQERVQLLLLNLIKSRTEVKDYVGLSAYKRITRIRNCIKNNYLEGINRNLLCKL